MDIQYNEAELAFRDEVRAFVAEKLPKEISDKVKSSEHVSPEDMITWQRALYEKGAIPTPHLGVCVVAPSHLG